MGYVIGWNGYKAMGSRTLSVYWACISLHNMIENEYEVEIRIPEFIKAWRNEMNYLEDSVKHNKTSIHHVQLPKSDYLDIMRLHNGGLFGT